MAAAFWMVTIPNENHPTAEESFRALKQATGEFAQGYRVDIPELLVGTLDSLMSLSDELGKFDANIESVVRKIERQFADLAGGSAEPLKIGSASGPRFVEQFAWDIAKYPTRRPLPDLVSLIVSGVAGIEEELKQFSISLAELNQRLGGLNRKKGGNLTMMPLEEVVKPSMVSHFIDTEYLRTVFIVVPKALDNEFLQSYHTIGEDIAGYGGPDWSSQQQSCGAVGSDYGPYCDRRRVSGSPIVPGSHKRVLQQGEHFLYSIVVLKGQYEAGYLEDDEFHPGNYVDFLDHLKTAAKERRFTIREYTPSSGESGRSLVDEIKEVELQVQGNTAALRRWCENHFGEAFSAWIHLKVVRSFVESVLRYGLPPNLCLAMLRVNRGKETSLNLAIEKFLKIDQLAAPLDDPDEAEYETYCKFDFNVSG